MFKRTESHYYTLSSAQVILLGFICMILIGTFLLMLPIASADHTSVDFLSALFTATSASCVTGLIVRDTATSWTLFGQTVILIMIQIGGMGVVTMTTFLSRLSGKKIGLNARITMQEAVSARNLSSILNLTGFIVKGTLVIELSGAVLLAPVFIRDFGFFKGIWYALFHSISAFCNAGFDLMGVREPFSSMTGYSSDPLVIITLCFLILLGGLGFVTWDDIRDNGIHFRKYSLQSKLILISEAVLIIFPMIFFYFNETEGLPVQEKILVSLFHAISPRTAGFNTVDYGTFSGNGIAITIVLMLIGGAPGSTAGGMKITTVVILVISMVSLFQRKRDPAVLGKRITQDTVISAGAVFTFDLLLFLSSSIFISCVEKLPLMSTMFECASAVATVGLSLGLTPTLSAVSKVVLIMIMYLGRIGAMTMVYAAVSRKDDGNGRYPKENIAVG